MNHRNWATPLTIGAFVLTSVTGVLLFFHIDSGLNKPAHEWLGWALIVGGIAHLATNFASFKKYLRQPLGMGIIGAFVLLLALSFLSATGHGEAPVRAIMMSLTETKLDTLATVARLSPDELKLRLGAEGIDVSNPQQQSLRDLTAGDRERQIELLGAVFANPAARR